MSDSTSDLCDRFGDEVRVAAPIFADFGGRLSFQGQIVTVKVYEDNVLVRAELETAGQGRVLVIDGGGSLRCALVGDQVGGLARANGWAGLVIYGCVRDTSALKTMDLGIKALAACPRKSAKKGWGEREIPLTFAGQTFRPGEWLAADSDGIVVSAAPF